MKKSVMKKQIIKNSIAALAGGWEARVLLKNSWLQNDVEKQLVFSFTALYNAPYKPQFFSRTGSVARVSCGVWYSTQETDAEPAVYSHRINSTRVPSPLAVSGVSRMGGENSHKPLQYFEAACAVSSAIQ